MNSEELNAVLRDLTQLKDELTLKANLGAAEAQDALKELEPGYNDLKLKLEKLSEIAGDSASELKAAAELGIDAESKEDVNTALSLAADELKDAYSKIKKLF